MQHLMPSPDTVHCSAWWQALTQCIATLDAKPWHSVLEHLMPSSDTVYCSTGCQALTQCNATLDAKPWHSVLQYLMSSPGRVYCGIWCQALTQFIAAPDAKLWYNVLQQLLPNYCILYLYTFFKFTPLILHLFQVIVENAQENNLCEVHSPALLFLFFSDILTKTK